MNPAEPVVIALGQAASALILAARARIDARARSQRADLPDFAPFFPEDCVWRKTEG